jgi:hypothetical protein
MPDLSSSRGSEGHKFGFKDSLNMLLSNLLVSIQ